MTSRQVAAGEHIKLQDAFEAVFMTTLAPRQAVMVDIPTGSFEFYDFGFSPGAIEIFRPILVQYGAEACHRPSRKDLGLLVGHSDVLDELVPRGEPIG